MKIEMTPEEAARHYVGKAITLMDTACTVIGPCSCQGCPLLIPNQQTPNHCILQKIKRHLYAQ